MGIWGGLGLNLLESSPGSIFNTQTQIWPRLNESQNSRPIPLKIGRVQPILGQVLSSYSSLIEGDNLIVIQSIKKLLEGFLELLLWFFHRTATIGCAWTKISQPNFSETPILFISKRVNYDLKSCEWHKTNFECTYLSIYKWFWCDSNWR